MSRSKKAQKPQVALVHDYLNQWGGAEQVLASLASIYPDASVYTMFKDEALALNKGYRKAQRALDMQKVRVSGLQRLPPWLRNSRLLLPFYPTAVETLDVSHYDVVISDSSAYAKGILTRPDGVHINYCHSPTRFLWDWHQRYQQEQPVARALGVLIEPLMSYVRLWDRWAADRVDYFVANSHNVRERIAKYYQRDAVVIYPPVDVRSHAQEIPRAMPKRVIKSAYDGHEEDRDYYLIVARLSAYKKIDMAIEACNRLQVPLHVVGAGREEARLKKLAWGKVVFHADLDRTALEQHYRKCKALIMPGVEDFGMVMVEAMAFGKPVIAFRAGGALEIIKAGVSGEFFDRENVRSLMDAIRGFEASYVQGGYRPREIFDSVLRFDQREFENHMREFVDQVSQLPIPTVA